MHWLYNIAIRAYLLSIRFSSYFNPKARKWIEGRRDVFDKLNQIPDDNRPLAWFHCASLGEFEQGRPVIEAFRTHYPHYRILLTFFSPSGYEIRKNYKQADVVCYLPADTPGNASRFVERINASLVVFVKYEYWHNFIHQITRRQMPFYVLSANFRNDQYFFRWWGKWFLKNMKKTTHFFVQHQDSALLLQHHNIKHVTITGDTRLDRVMAIANEEISLPIIEKFVAGHKVLVAGSTWPPDEKLLARLIMEVSQPIKLII
ncbi:MAG: glycosyltransferase N-terminal domain-containing protein, partial [Bacteroidales bacterium]|nr:glycosyltransferase N-terminal domain-containing protein [Bacteroidales bacterium]